MIVGRGTGNCEYMCKGRAFQDGSILELVVRSTLLAIRDPSVIREYLYYAARCFLSSLIVALSRLDRNFRLLPQPALRRVALVT